MSRRKQWSLDQVIDLDSYPLLDLDSLEGAALVARCKAQFADAVCCALPGFVRPAAIDAVIAEVDAKQHRSHPTARYVIPYSEFEPIHDERVTTLADDDPHLEPQRRRLDHLAYDEFAADSVIHRLYESPELTTFAAAVLGVPELCRVADPLMAAPVSLHYDGCELGWHCDTPEFVITVMFRPAEAGGQFQYFPKAGPRDENFERVPHLLQGDCDGVKTVPFDAGTIMLFRGASTLHRVTPARGEKPRIIAILHFETTPGRIYSDEFKLDAFGRVA